MPGNIYMKYNVSLLIRRFDMIKYSLKNCICLFFVFCLFVVFFVVVVVLFCFVFFFVFLLLFLLAFPNNVDNVVG